jgi:uncharacterized membrane protein
MSTLVAVAYDSEGRAAEVLKALRYLEHKQLIDLEDAVYTVKDRSGEVHLHQTEHHMAEGAGKRAVAGTIVGAMVAFPLLVVGPIAALVATAAVGGAGVAAAVKGGEQKDTGVNDEFANKLASHSPPGSSILFVLVRRSEPDQVIEEIRPYGGVVLHSTLSRSAERRLREALKHPEGEAPNPDA